MSRWNSGWGVVWLVGSIACGGRAEDGADGPSGNGPDSPGGDPASIDGVETDVPATAGPNAPGARGGSAAPAPPASPPPRAAPPPPSAQRPAAAPAPPVTSPTDPISLERLSLMDQMNVYCGDCHGSAARANGNVQGDLGYIDDLDELVQKGLVIPFNAPASPVFKVITDGSMPPPGVYPRPGQALLELMRSVIEPDLYWGDEPAGRLPDADPLTQ